MHPTAEHLKPSLFWSLHWLGENANLDIAGSSFNSAEFWINSLIYAAVPRASAYGTFCS